MSSEGHEAGDGIREMWEVLKKRYMTHSLTTNGGVLHGLDPRHDLCQIREGGVGTRDHLKHTQRLNQSSTGGTFLT